MEGTELAEMDLNSHFMDHMWQWVSILSENKYAQNSVLDEAMNKQMNDCSRCWIVPVGVEEAFGWQNVTMWIINTSMDYDMLTLMPWKYQAICTNYVDVDGNGAVAEYSIADSDSHISHEPWDYCDTFPGACIHLIVIMGSLHW